MPALPLGEIKDTGNSPLPKPSCSPKYIAVGLGTQNYTCNATTGKYTATGALAQLFDATAYLSNNHDKVDSLSHTYYNTYTSLPCSKSPSNCVESDDRCEDQANSHFKPWPLPVLGEHYFTASGTPTFDLHNARSHPFLFSKKAGDVASPRSYDVDWLYLSSNGSSENRVISSVYRVETVGGVQPASCSGTSSIEVPYSAEYWYYA
ncbi:Protein of unknown function DUF3455 [Teratosphaeria destructans]|uniref:Malate dehydrogenase n=1 Tax=Teratosphaeria destructans TaxID=418781 RepID=A0A9W7W4U7_9PEZI|nr:Protein of unknown function DUF3455 [Teratosphaeria destructans]